MRHYQTDTEPEIAIPSSQPHCVRMLRIRSVALFRLSYDHTNLPMQCEEILGLVYRTTNLIFPSQSLFHARPVACQSQHQRHCLVGVACLDVHEPH